MKIGKTGKIILTEDNELVTLGDRDVSDDEIRVVRKVKEKRGDGIYTKSGIMLGLGETEEELLAALEDLRDARCDLLTLGQYLQPTLKHLPVAEFIPPAKFVEYGERARQMGFVHVASGPMVRSSYHADDFSPAAISAHTLPTE
jgi:lipoic acid synthetase